MRVWFDEIRQAGKDGELSKIDVEHLIEILKKRELLIKNGWIYNNSSLTWSHHLQNGLYNSASTWATGTHFWDAYKIFKSQ